MKNRRRRVQPLSLLALLLSVCLCIGALCSMRIQGPGMEAGGVEELPSHMRSGAQPPSGGTCANVNQVYPENPFTGWPVVLYPGDWRVISSWFCDPDYFKGYTHWGIDLAARITVSDGVSTWDSLNGAEVVCTTDRGYVSAAVADGGWNYGMGNHVTVRAVDCDDRCGTYPPDENAEGEHVYLIEYDSPECLVGTPTPGTPAPEDDFYDDLMMVCVENGWKAIYMHLLSVSVSAGDLVERDAVLGRIDNTGNSTGTHLHYQINGPGVGAIDPAPAMCVDYNPDVRYQYRWQRDVCATVR